MRGLLSHVRPVRLRQHPLARAFATSSTAASSWKVDNPYTGAVQCEVPLHPAASLPSLLSLASTTQRSWSSSPLSDRQSLVLAFADRLAANKARVAADITNCMGKPISQALGEVDTCIGRARSLVAQSDAALAPMEFGQLKASPSLRRRVTKEPVGVVLSLCPWNYPLLCAVNSVVPAVLSGCSVLLKHSDRTPLAAEAFSSFFADAGAPRGLVQHVHVDHDTVARLVKEPAIAYVQFTGSVGGGRAVYTAVGRERFIDVGLELGGKDAAYVMDDADMDSVVDNVLEGALYNAGQSCCSVERVYLHRAMAGAFIERAQAVIAKAWSIGDPSKPSTALGPLAQPGSAERIVQRLRDAQAKGARLLHGGTAALHEGKGRFLIPALVVDCPEECELMREETFGPVVACAMVDGDEEAVRRINGSRYGLTASVWGRDVGRVEELGRKLDVGTVYMNRCDVLDPELTWSGRKDSGKGFGLGQLGFLPFIRSKSWNLKTKP